MLITDLCLMLWPDNGLGNMPCGMPYLPKLKDEKFKVPKGLFRGSLGVPERFHKGFVTDLCMMLSPNNGPVICYVG